MNIVDDTGYQYYFLGIAVGRVSYGNAGSVGDYMGSQCRDSLFHSVYLRVPCREGGCYAQVDGGNGDSLKDGVEVREIHYSVLGKMHS